MTPTDTFLCERFQCTMAAKWCVIRRRKHRKFNPLAIVAMQIGCHRGCAQGLEIEAAIGDQVPTDKELTPEDLKNKWRGVHEAKDKHREKRRVIDGKKPCSKCRKLLPIGEFPFLKAKGRHDSWCKECKRRAVMDLYYRRHPQKEKHEEAPEGHKRCPKCETIRPVAEFYWSKVKQAYMSWCKPCNAEYEKSRPKRIRVRRKKV